ncbi:MAG: hypothetical protein AB7Q29_09055 [Vicinamibacterales bacterium]
MRRSLRFASIVALVLSVSGCAVPLRHPHISDLRANPGRYHNRAVSIDGIVTTAWGAPFAPYRMYRVSDGTGEVLVLSRSRHVPTRGTRVRVRGRLDDMGVAGGRALGLHLREERMRNLGR